MGSDVLMDKLEVVSDGIFYDQLSWGVRNGKVLWVEVDVNEEAPVWAVLVRKSRILELKKPGAYQRKRKELLQKS